MQPSKTPTPQRTPHDDGPGTRRRFPSLPRLSPTTRVLLLALGWLLLALGLVGLLLPGLQGVLTLILGAAALSLVSQTVLNLLRTLFRPWPRAWRLLLRTRRRVHYWFEPKEP